jgi:hypothetical protein
MTHNGFAMRPHDDTGFSSSLPRIVSSAPGFDDVDIPVTPFQHLSPDTGEVYVVLTVFSHEDEVSVDVVGVVDNDLVWNPVAGVSFDVNLTVGCHLGHRSNTD